MTEQASGRPPGGLRSQDPLGGVEMSRWAWLLPAGVILVVAGIVTALVLSERDADELGSGEARLLPAGRPGPDPFAVVDVRPVPPTGLPLPPAPAGSSVRGDVGGLYAGVRDAPRCPADNVGAALSAGEGSVDTRAVWAEASSIDPDEIDAMLDALIPVILRRDTLVTSHRLDGGVAVPEAAVLQRGTAVLVDDRGVPRVRCAGAQPLDRARRSAGRYTFEGTSWLGFATGEVVRVAAARAPVDGLVLVDPTTGATFVRGRGGVVDTDG